MAEDKSVSDILNEALVYYNLKTRRRQSTAWIDAADVVAKYAAGVSMPKIAAQYDVSTQAIHWHLKRAGALVRDRLVVPELVEPPPKPKNHRGVLAGKTQEIIDRFMSGASEEEIAAEHNVSKTAIHYVLRKACVYAPKRRP